MYTCKERAFPSFVLLPMPGFCICTHGFDHPRRYRVSSPCLKCGALVSSILRTDMRTNVNLNPVCGFGGVFFQAALIKCAIRHVKYICGLDLSSCTKWLKFMEVQYQHVDSAGNPYTEVSCRYTPPFSGLQSGKRTT